MEELFNIPGGIAFFVSICVTIVCVFIFILCFVNSWNRLVDIFYKIILIGFGVVITNLIIMAITYFF